MIDLAPSSRTASRAAALSVLASALAVASCTTVSDDTSSQPPRALGIQQQASALGGKFVACADCVQPTPKTIATAHSPAVPQHVTVLPPAAASSQPAINLGAWVPPSTRQSTPSQTTHDLYERATLEFRFDTADLSPAVRSKLTQLAPLFRAATRVRMIGFTDDVGPQGINDKLAADRAMRVHLFVRQLLGGAANPALTSRGDALCCYLTDNRNEAQRSVNRRVEVLITLSANAQTRALVRQFARLLVPTNDWDSLSVTEAAPGDVLGPVPLPTPASSAPRSPMARGSLQ